VTTQATSWQLGSRYSVRVGEAVETSVMKLYGDPPGLWELLWVRLNRGGHRSRFQPGENLTPPIDGGSEDPSVTTKALAGRYAAIHWLIRHATH
jgi:hypothetical protein